MPSFPPKLEKILNKNNYAIESVFVYKDICRYIRIISLKTGDCIVLYIDPEFKFSKPPEKQATTMQFVDFVADNDNVIDKFHEYPDTKEVEGKYRIAVPIKTEEENFEDKVEGRYRHKIFLKDMDKPKLLNIKSCFRQLQRLSLTTQDLQYKLCIFDGVYMFIVEDDDIINCYQVSNSSTLQISVVIGLELFYKKMESVAEDSATIKKSLYNLITKNHTSSFGSIKTLIKSLQESFSSMDIVSNKQMELDTSMAKTSELLEKTNSHLEALLEKYRKLEEAKPSEDLYVHEKKRIEDSIKSTELLKQKLLNYIIALKEQKDRLFLSLDQVEFDTSIFINGICKRMKEFDEMKK